MKAIKQVLRQDKEPYRIPKRVQDVIPIKRIWSDGIFLAGTRYCKSFKFTDINYMVASEAEQKKMFLSYAALVNSLDCGATTKITINNRHLNRKNFENAVLMKMEYDGLDLFRDEYNAVIMDKATAGNGIIQEKYVTVSVCKKNIAEARAYFTRVGAELSAKFAALGAKATELDATERLRILHDFYRSGEEVYFRFDMRDMMKKGHDFRDYICPDSIEKHSDYLMLGGKYARVIYLKDYAAFISDQFVNKLTDQSRSMMLSIDIIPVATLCTVREKLLEQPEPEAQDIALTMELYTSGSLDIFAHETNVDTKNRIISYDIHDLSEDLKQPGFVTITDAMLNRVNFIWAQGKKTHVIVDEFHIAYENEYSGNFFTSAWRQFRKRNASPVAITQNVDYLLDAPQARSMLSNSEFIVMLNQAEKDQERLSQLLNISPEQMRYVNGSEAGSGLLRYGNALVPFINKFPMDTELYRLITTRPGEGVFAKGQVDFDA